MLAIPKPIQEALREFQTYSLRRAQGAETGRGKALMQALALTVCTECDVRPGDPSPGLQRALKCFRVDCQIRPKREFGRVGQLAAHSGGFTLTVFEDDVPQLSFDSLQMPISRRGWFTLGHEIAHVAFYRLESPNATPARIVSRPLLSKQDRNREEGLCEDFSRSLLLPDFEKMSIPPEASMSTLLTLWRERNWHLPLVAVVRRILHDWCLWPEAVLVSIRRDGSVKPRVWGRHIVRQSPSLGKDIRSRLGVLVGVPHLGDSERMERLRRVGITACVVDSEIFVLVGEQEMERLRSEKPRRSVAEQLSLF